MPGAVLQLNHTGKKDLALTGNLNLFRYKFNKYVNFATEITEVPLNTSVKWGGGLSTRIDVKGDLLTKVYLHIKLPKLTFTDGSYACWCDTVGLAIFKEPITFTVDGIEFDVVHPRYADFIDSLMSKDTSKNRLVMRADLYMATQNNAIQETDLFIPIPFWFTKSYNFGLPLQPIEGREMVIKTSFNKFSDLVCYDGTMPHCVPILKSSLYVETVFVDPGVIPSETELTFTRAFSSISFDVPANTSSALINIESVGLCKEVLFGIVDKNNKGANCHFSYSKREDNTSLIDKAGLLLDGIHRFGNKHLDEIIFRVYYPNNNYATIPDRYTYVMPFCIKGNSITQPSGAINLDTFDSAGLSLQFTQNSPDKTVYVFTSIYWSLKVSSGKITLSMI